MQKWFLSCRLGIIGNGVTEPSRSEPTSAPHSIILQTFKNMKFSQVIVLKLNLFKINLTINYSIFQFINHHRLTWDYSPTIRKSVLFFPNNLGYRTSIAKRLKTVVQNGITGQNNAYKLIFDANATKEKETFDSMSHRDF